MGLHGLISGLAEAIAVDVRPRRAICLFCLPVSPVYVGLLLALAFYAWHSLLFGTCNTTPDRISLRALVS